MSVVMRHVRLKVLEMGMEAKKMNPLTPLTPLMILFIILMRIRVMSPERGDIEVI